MKKWIPWLLLIVLTLPGAHAEQKYDAIPYALQVHQEIYREYIRDDAYISRTYPTSNSRTVDAEIRELVDAMAEKNRPLIPGGKSDLMPMYLDVGATIFRTGTKWMSFLTIARVAYEREQIAVDMQTRTFDMESGERLTLKDVIAEDGWDVLCKAVREQLTAYFPGQAPNADVLDALCTREALEQADFTLGAARLMLHYRADTLYPRRNTLMHVALYYADIRAYMTPEAFEQTDNSRYKMIALTYDDGPARGTTQNLINVLRNNAAGATFFVVGTMLNNNHDNLMREHDAGYAVQSHNYSHEYNNLTSDKLFAWKDKLNETLASLIGTQARYMRPPGGLYEPYARVEIGYSLILWDAAAGDASQEKGNTSQNKYDRVMGNAHDGGIVLMHDLNVDCPEYTQMILEGLERKGYLCVTVDELFSNYDIPMLENVMYRSVLPMY